MKGKMRLFSLLTFCAFGVYSEFISYLQHRIFPLRPEYLAFPKYAKKDVPNWSPGHGRSFIDLARLSFSLDCAFTDNCKKTNLDLLMFEEPKEFPWQDYWTDRNFCCTKDLVDTNVCSSAGSLIVPAALEQKLTQTISIDADTLYTPSHTDVIYHHDISETGMYVLIMAVCNDDGAPVIVDGVVDSMDPYGYLPADLFGNLPFYGFLSCLYTVVGVVWLIVCSMYSRELMPLQYWITAVLFLGMVETSLLFGHYLNWNDDGYPSYGVTIIGLIAGVLKRTLSRVVVQLVALGYGVVRPSLGEDMKRVLSLGGAYCICSLIYTISNHLPPGSKAVDQPAVDMNFFLVMLLSGIDTTFYIWIVSSINNLLVTLASRRQAVKYILYRDFRAVLFVSIFFTLIWVLYSVVIESNDGHGADGSWKSKWTSGALFEMTYFAVFVAIAYLWAPSKNSQRYAAYDSIEMTALDDDEEWRQSQELDKDSGSRAAGADDVDSEYGGRLNDESDPFHGTGALDTNSAIQKKS